MTDLQMFQAYWWLLICVLGAVLVFMLFVLGGQSMLFCRHDLTHRQLMVNSLGRKWELTFTSLVVFGGAFFASFPLYYSTSFGGAYWLWMLILFSFVLQAVSYEFRRKRGNLYGTRTYDIFLLVNGVVGCVLLGCAVGMMYFGADFEVTRVSLLDPASPVISRWGDAHGFDVIACWKCLLLGVTVFFLARTLASLYFINNIRGAGEAFEAGMRRSALVNGVIFAVLFVTFAVVLLLQTGYRADAGGTVEAEPYLYLHNLLGMWWWGVIFAAGVVMVLCGIGTALLPRLRSGIWYAGIGTVLVVVAMLAVAGYGDTCYLPSLTHPQSSLTLANSSSSLFTLRVMSWVSLLVPFVLAYIWYVWSKMNAGGLTPADVDDNAHQY
ncbi:MAG: cytochrome d ubiquinol oxidase subunit II [Bacteroides sp.]|nr:cytochrome d ubiquinol oxidase subunit II [Bacteroides sp.]MCM1096006.1 cytochrome d ubiquinol oxidase subunit II [Terasakiella sp.]